MGRMTRWAARLYPRWWRERYGEEFAALLEDARPGARGTFDILRGALIMQMSTMSAKRLLLLCAVAGMLIGLGAASMLKPQYISTAVLTIAESNTNQAAREQLDAASRQALSQDTLVRLIQDMNLYPRERKTMPWAEMLKMMRNDIRLTLIAGRTKNSVSAFSIRFLYSDRDTAQRVVSALGEQFQASNFVLLEPASHSLNPTFPNRPAVAAIGLVAGALAGAIWTLARRYRRREA